VHETALPYFRSGIQPDGELPTGQLAENAAAATYSLAGKLAALAAETNKLRASS